MNATPTWLIWRMEANSKAQLQAGLARYQERFGAAANAAVLSARAPDELSAQVHELLQDVKTSEYIFNPREVFVGRVEHVNE